jgi:hypothetical protein
MVNQQVYIERSTINNQGYLAANKGEAAAELKEEVAEVGEQSSLQLPLREWLSEGQESRNCTDRVGSARPYPSQEAARNV